jgi:hypothetical protein
MNRMVELCTIVHEECHGVEWQRKRRYGVEYLGADVKASRDGLRLRYAVSLKRRAWAWVFMGHLATNF